MENIYYAHIHSHMSYGLLFWGNHGMASRVFKLQKRAIRTISSDAQRTHSRPLFAKYRILTLYSMYVLSCLVYIKSNITNYDTVSSVHNDQTLDLSSESIDLSPMAFRFYNGDNSTVYVDVPFDKGEEIIDLPGFDPSKKVLIYIHGFKENMNLTSIHVITNAFLERGDTNVIALDWTEYAAKDYITALLNCIIRVANAADIIKKMVARGVPLENFHLIGYSLGAQCAGYIGKRFKEQKLKTITGLDPAGPILGFFCLTSLHKGDAEFVHMIHTDRGVYGISRSCESVNDESEFICRVCDNYKDFVNGNCGNNTLKAAYGADPSFCEDWMGNEEMNIFLAILWLGSRVTTSSAAFRKHGEVNVIALDWSGYSTKDYITALLNCVIQVARAADIIKKMVARGISLENFHLVGFSLGAQYASSIGKRFKEQKPKIITGLDPAGPITGYFCQTSLHKEDAEFVQIIHTDRGIYGTSRSCGDLDVFFNNDGYRIQPGCPCVLLPFGFTSKK
ncbi:hypothetical protein C0J52_03419 [Blattella germanica]|nr:hypothetical protein C0J52_03419 [Blattella germanica]